MKMPKEFLEDEVRCGFYVPSMMKKAWASGIQILYQIDRICKKYNIKYFADYGTLLGAVRHGGFVPWDDDLDISMMREDYNRFCEVAPKELPGSYFILNFHNDPNFEFFLARVTSNTHICFEEEHLRQFNGFPYMIGVDIFVLDYVNPDKEKERMDLCKRLITIGDMLHENNDNKELVHMLAAEVYNLCGKRINIEKPLRQQVFTIVEEIFGEVSEKDAAEIAQSFPWRMLGTRTRFPKNYYEKTTELKFEYITVQVPVCYNAILSKKYSNYLKIVKNRAAHVYPFFSKQKKDLEETMGFSVPDFIEPDYRITSETIDNIKNSRRTGGEVNYKKIIFEAVNELVKLHEKLGLYCLETNDNTYEMLDCLSMCQEKALVIGSAIEGIMGENVPEIACIEDYCEQVYQVYQMLSSDGIWDAKYISSLDELMNKINCTSREVINKKIIVFVPFKSNYWNKFEKVWKEAEADTDCITYVVPVPYYYKNYDGTLGEEVYDIQSYPDCLNAKRYDELNIEYLHPDIIYIQNPYDSYNASTSIHPDFYSEKLINYTDELIYIPYFETDDFDDTMHCEKYNMRYYCTMPGVIYADRVILSGEEIKKRYIETLAEAVGEEYWEFWNKKIAVEEAEKNIELYSKTKKIYYQICISSFIEYGISYVRKVEKSLNLFKNNTDRISLVFCVQPQLNDYIQINNDSDCEKLRSIIEEYKTEGWGKFNLNGLPDESTDEYFCYYGDPAPEVMKFNEKGKIAVIQNIDC